MTDLQFVCHPRSEHQQHVIWSCALSLTLQTTVKQYDGACLRFHRLCVNRCITFHIQCEVCDVQNTFLPSSWLVSVDLPAFGAPTIATLRDLGLSGWSGSFSNKENWWPKSWELKNKHVNDQPICKSVRIRLKEFSFDILSLKQLWLGLGWFWPQSDGTGCWLWPSLDTTALPFCNLSKKASEDTHRTGAEWKRHFLTACAWTTAQAVNEKQKGNKRHSNKHTTILHY